MKVIRINGFKVEDIELFVDPYPFRKILYVNMSINRWLNVGIKNIDIVVNKTILRFNIETYELSLYDNKLEIEYLNISILDEAQNTFVI